MRKADKLPPSCAVVTKSGNLNFLEPSGPVQACNGTDFTFFTIYGSFYSLYMIEKDIKENLNAPDTFSASENNQNNSLSKIHKMKTSRPLEGTL